MKDSIAKFKEKLENDSATLKLDTFNEQTDGNIRAFIATGLERRGGADWVFEQRGMLSTNGRVLLFHGAAQSAVSTAYTDVVSEIIEEKEISLETNVDWTETGVIELAGLVGGEVYTFVTVADGESHTINIDSVDETTGTVVVIIQSEPQTITLTLESPVAEVDLNDDSVADMRVTLVGISDGEATINVEKIDELFEEPSQGLSAWIWVLIIVLVLAIAGTIVYFVTKPKSKKRK